MKKISLSFLFAAVLSAFAADVHIDKNFDYGTKFAAKDLVRCLSESTGKKFTLKESAASHKNGDIIIIGNEGNGLSDRAKELCKRRITIPITGRAESFNAASAAAILMWELMK